MNEFSEELISAYLDGELTAEEQSHVEEALAHNAELRQTLDSLRALSQTLQSLPRREPATDWSARVLARASSSTVDEPHPGARSAAVDETHTLLSPASLDAEASHEPRSWRWLWPLAAVAAAIAVIIFGPWKPDRPSPVAVREVDPNGTRTIPDNTPTEPRGVDETGRQPDGLGDREVSADRPIGGGGPAGFGGGLGGGDIGLGGGGLGGGGGGDNPNPDTDAKDWREDGAEPSAGGDLGDQGRELSRMITSLNENGRLTLKLALLADEGAGAVAIEQILARNNIRLEDAQFDDHANSQALSEILNSKSTEVESNGDVRSSESGRDVTLGDEPVTSADLKASLAGDLTVLAASEVASGAISPTARVYIVDASSGQISGALNDLQRTGELSEFELESVDEKSLTEQDRQTFQFREAAPEDSNGSAAAAPFAPAHDRPEAASASRVRRGPAQAPGPELEPATPPAETRDVDSGLPDSLTTELGKDAARGRVKEEELREPAPQIATSADKASNGLLYKKGGAEEGESESPAKAEQGVLSRPSRSRSMSTEPSAPEVPGIARKFHLGKLPQSPTTQEKVDQASAGRAQNGVEEAPTVATGTANRERFSANADRARRQYREKSEAVGAGRWRLLLIVESPAATSRADERPDDPVP